MFYNARDLEIWFVCEACEAWSYYEGTCHTFYNANTNNKTKVVGAVSAFIVSGASVKVTKYFK